MRVRVAEKRLASLAFAHYVVACLMVLNGGVFIAQYLFMKAMMEKDNEWSMHREEAFFSFFVMAIKVGFAVYCVVAILQIVAGFLVKRRQGYRFCMVIAIVSCLFMPFGTVLGILSLLALMNPDIGALFETQRLGGTESYGSA